jgi:hypothetical protein
MSLLREILAEAFLLREDASVDAINNAVNNMHPVRIVYNGPSGAGNGEREIYPVAYGISTAGNLVVRAFQPQGSTSSEVPAWKFFRLDRIKRWDNDNSRTFNPEELNGFNENGDEQIETLYAISPIGNARTEKQPEKPEEPEKVLTGHPVRKGEVDNGGADKNTEREYYTANDAVRDILQTSNPKIGQTQDKNIDKVAGQDYNSKETQPVRDAVPVTKTDIDPNAANEPDDRNPDLYGNDGPVMKDDLTPETGNTLTNSFNDLTNRMNNLYNDEEEEENR